MGTPLVRLDVGLPLSNRRWDAALQVPAGPAEARTLWPIFDAVNAAVLQWAAEDAAQAGAPVSCRSGCAACCRHLVPVSALELQRLRDAWAELPGPEREAVDRRLHSALARLHQAELAEPLGRLEELSADELRALIAHYFSLRIDCPFLVQEACTVYEQRPMACREHLVNSPPSACAGDDAEAVQRLPLPAESVGRALRAFNGPGFAPARGWRPMVLALAAPEPAGERQDQGSGPDLAQRFFEALVAQRPPA